MPELIDEKYDREYLVEYKASGGSKLILRQKGWNDAIDTTVDGVKLVRCEDCKYSLTPDWDSDEVYCTKHNNWFKIDGYCHLGRKKDAEIN
jgi:hypothetical protein